MIDGTDNPTIREDRGLQILIAIGHPLSPYQPSKEATAGPVNIWIERGLNLYEAAEIYLRVLKPSPCADHPAGMGDFCARTIGPTDRGACDRNLKRL